MASISISPPRLPTSSDGRPTCSTGTGQVLHHFQSGGLLFKVLCEPKELHLIQSIDFQQYWCDKLSPQDLMAEDCHILTWFANSIASKVTTCRCHGYTTAVTKTNMLVYLEALVKEGQRRKDDEGRTMKEGQ